jgi:hypothetical protein
VNNPAFRVKRVKICTSNSVVKLSPDSCQSHQPKAKEEHGGGFGELTFYQSELSKVEEELCQMARQKEHHDL